MIKPILFNTEMVRAILEGRKTVTRRAVKLKYSNTHLEMRTDKYGTRLIELQNEEPGVTTVRNPDGTTTHKLLAAEDKVPPYKRNDILWVRETWCESLGQAGKYFYRAYAGPRDETKEYAHSFNRWRPSIYMPKEAARLFLRVTGVRMERLQNITEEGALAEGVPDKWPIDPVYCPYCKGEGLVGAVHPASLGYMEVDCPECAKATSRFSNLWYSTIKPADRPLYGWEANPWVWVIEFERCEKPEGF